MRGGARKGAGRKPGTTKIFTAFKLERTIVSLLHELPKGQRTKFVEQALLKALKAAKNLRSVRAKVSI
jgi:hypothetical protein